MIEIYEGTNTAPSRILKDNETMTEIKQKPLYFLSHPLTAYGIESENRKREAECARAIKQMYGDTIDLYRPLASIQVDASYDNAMNICMNKLSMCDVIVLCEFWFFSDGCSKESHYAKDKGITRFTLSKRKGMFRLCDDTGYPIAECSVSDCAEKEHDDTDPQPDNINHPSHYLDGGIETIAILQAKLTAEEFSGFCKGNAIKYLSRAGKKTLDPREDYKNARWYLDKLIEVTDELA